jgi:hypothetical protein
MASRQASLWDIMINYRAYDLYDLLLSLHSIQVDFELRSNCAADLHVHGQKLIDGLKPKFRNREWARVNDDDVSRIKELLKKSRAQAERLELQAVLDRIVLFTGRLDSDIEITLHNFLAEVRALRETIETGIAHRCFYVYPPDRCRLVLRFTEDWKQVTSAFPDTVDDALAALDCYGLEYGTASVFHSMRVLETGLAALSQALGLSFETEVWHVIIDRIEYEIRELEKTWPRGPVKTDFLKFYSEAAKEFRYFKDGWRNYVSHKRVPYDAPQALSTLNHVRDFMGLIAARLGA